MNPQPAFPLDFYILAQGQSTRHALVQHRELCEAGVAQIQKVRDTHLKDVPLTMIVTSKTLCARRSAEVIRKRRWTIPIIELPDLRHDGSKPLDQWAIDVSMKIEDLIDKRLRQRGEEINTDDKVTVLVVSDSEYVPALASARSYSGQPGDFCEELQSVKPAQAIKLSGTQYETTKAELLS
jgi:hypothetical protein